MRPILAAVVVLLGSPCIGAQFLMRDGSMVRGSYDPDSSATTLRVRVGLPTAYLIRTYRWADVQAVVLPSGQVGTDEFRRRLQADAGAASTHRKRLADIDAQAGTRIQAELDAMRAAGHIDGPALKQKRTAILGAAHQLRSREQVRYAKQCLAKGDEVGARVALLTLLRTDPDNPAVRDILGPDETGVLLAVLQRQRDRAEHARLRRAARQTPHRLPHITMLDVVQAHYADWDYDADVDGLVVVIQPRDAQGAPVAASGRLTAKLFVRQTWADWQMVENWNERVELNPHDVLGATVRLEYQVLGRPGFYSSIRWGVLELEFFPNGSDRTVSARVGGLVLEPWVSPFRPYTASRR